MRLHNFLTCFIACAQLSYGISFTVDSSKDILNGRSPQVTDSAGSAASSSFMDDRTPRKPSTSTKKKSPPARSVESPSPTSRKESTTSRATTSSSSTLPSTASASISSSSTTDTTSTSSTSSSTTQSISSTDIVLTITMTASIFPATTPTQGPSSPTIVLPIATAGFSSTAASPGMSSGAKAGIGIGIALGALALTGLGIFGFLWRRKRQAAVIQRGINRMSMLEKGNGGSSENPLGGPLLDSSAWVEQNVTGMGEGYRGVKGVTRLSRPFVDNGPLLDGGILLENEPPAKNGPMTENGPLMEQPIMSPMSPMSPITHWSGVNSQNRRQTFPLLHAPMSPKSPISPITPEHMSMSAQPQRQTYIAYNGPSTAIIEEDERPGRRERRSLGGLVSPMGTDSDRGYDRRRSLGTVSSATVSRMGTESDGSDRRKASVGAVSPISERSLRRASTVDRRKESPPVPLILRIPARKPVGGRVDSVDSVG
ncbi:hypothetical protein G7Y89_g8110 [Cudoniella acicularis]|uniref:Uncharacterized protein n=1 Tax=Cudoniella acicularis TaxID=354080 RepID=A0A8H4W1E5_9HELO|nr:hypothetical protein G7Y89_g8110 [Cudoniella acicularis]